MSDNNGQNHASLEGPKNGKGTTDQAHKPLVLSDQDQYHLEQYHKKVLILRDHVTAVGLGYQTGLFVFGGPGTGKSFNTIATLVDLKAPYQYHNSHMTACGLFEALRVNADAIHIFDDMEHLFTDKDSLGIIRSALFAQQRQDSRGPLERPIFWAKQGERKRASLRGGLIFLCNRDLPKKPEADAIRSRIPNMEFLVTQYEMQAFMRALALRGYQWDDHLMEPAECLDVCEFVIEQSLAWEHPLDMRLLTHGFKSYLQYQDGDAANHWHNLVLAQLRRELVSGTADVSYLSRSERRARDEQIVREILATTTKPAEQVQMWKERARKGRAQFYRVRDRVLNEE